MFKISDLEGNDELYIHQQIIVDVGQSPIRIDKYLWDRLEKISRNRIQNAIKANCVIVSEKPIKANYKVRPNDVISLLLPRDLSDMYQIKPQKVPLDIVYEDDQVLVINKQAGLVVHPGTGNRSKTLVHGLLYYFQGQELPLLNGNPSQRPGIVHRIDKNTSGLMVIAKTEYAMSVLAKQFFEHTIDREYLALSWGSPAPSKGTIRGYIGRNPRDKMQFMNFEEEHLGKRAVTHYEVVEDLYYVSLIKCKLETGRTHQIRVHLKSIGHTIFSDERYGGDRILKGTIFAKYRQFVDNCFHMMPRHALHARTLGFIHPTTGEHLIFHADLPPDFNAVLDKWRNYKQSRKEILEKEYYEEE